MPSLPIRKLSAEPIAGNMLPGDRLPILRRPQDEADPTKRNPTVSLATLQAWLGVGATPNTRRGGPFHVVTRTRAEADALGRYDQAALEELDPALLCLHCTATVDLAADADGQFLELVYDARPDGSAGQLRAYVDGNFHKLDQGDGLLPARWAKAGSQEAAEANVPLLDPARTDYPAGYQVRAVYGGVSYLFFSRQAGGPFLAPPDYTGDGNWGPVAPQVPATVLYQTYPLGYAQYQLSRFPESIKPGQLYLLPGTWNSAPGPPDTVEVVGGKGGFAALGTLVSAGTRQAVTVDVAAGTYSTTLGSMAPAPPELEATFGLGDADTATTTVGGKYAATYGTLTTVNVVTGTYTLNGGAAQQLSAPLTLAAGDTLAIHIQRNVASQGASVTFS